MKVEKNNISGASCFSVALVFLLILNPVFLKAKQLTPKEIYLNESRAETQNISSNVEYDHLPESKKEIFLLLRKIEQSPYEFIRNGISYDGKKAGKHFRWKYRYVAEKIKTPEEFIDHIATKSMQTNEKYFLKLSDKEVYPLGDILYNELAVIRRS